MTPEYLLCTDCETPCYTFEWKEDKAVEAVCEVCGNDDPALFLTEDEWETFALSVGDWREKKLRSSD